MSLALRSIHFTYAHEMRLTLTMPSLNNVAQRYYCKSSSANNSDPKENRAKSKLSAETMRENVKGYVFTRYFERVKNYDKVIEKNFPSAAKVYRVFFDGVKKFYDDMKGYLKISRIVKNSDNGIQALNRKELELYMQMPRDMIKVAPVIFLSSLPFVGYAVFPLVFMYPRTFLSSHFWSLEQKTEFQQLKMKERLICNRPVFRCLQSKLKLVKKHALHKDLNDIFGLVGSGLHPSAEQLLNIKTIFVEPPYSLQSLSSKHIKFLTLMHGLSSAWFNRYRLTEHAFLVHNMDLAIKREGDVHNMNSDAIKYSCFIRGLNPENLSNEEMIEWLRVWIKISTTIEEQHISLFLHLPLFLAYNHPNNWQLLHGSAGKNKSIIKVQEQQKKERLSEEQVATEDKKTKPNETPPNADFNPEKHVRKMRQ